MPCSYFPSFYANPTRGINVHSGLIGPCNTAWLTLWLVLKQLLVSLSNGSHWPSRGLLARLMMLSVCLHSLLTIVLCMLQYNASVTVPDSSGPER